MNYKIVLPGVPAYSSRGYLGWCSVSLISTDDTNILFDTGSCADRDLLLDELKKLEINRGEIDIVFLSHLHWDHCMNTEIFGDSKLLVSEREIDYFTSGKHKELGDELIPEASMRSEEDRMEGVNNGEEIADGVETVLLSGHTPGTMGLLTGNTVFTGDGLKNAWEFKNKQKPNPTYENAKKAVKNYDMVEEIAGTIVPGHDRPFRIEDGKIEYLRDHTVKINHYRDPEKEEQQIRF